MAVNVCKKFYAKQKELRKTKDPDRAQGREYGSMQQGFFSLHSNMETGDDFLFSLFLRSNSEGAFPFLRDCDNICPEFFSK